MNQQLIFPVRRGMRRREDRLRGDYGTEEIAHMYKKTLYRNDTGGKMAVEH
jgi:hypothetical protein